MPTDIVHYENITRAILSESRIVSTYTIDHADNPPSITIRVVFTPAAHRSEGTYTYRSTDAHEDSIREFGRMLQEVIPHGASRHDRAT